MLDDILALLLLAVATGLASGGELDVGDIVLVVAIAIAFVAFFALVGTRVTQRWPRSERFAVIVAMSVATTLIAPPLLRRALRVDSAAARSS